MYDIISCINKIMSKKESTFEELITKLEEITKELEKEGISLDESVKLFEEGMKISKECNEKLENAEKKISILINNGEELTEENFIVGQE